MSGLAAEVVVVGAGPAGTAAAITLARAGRQVVVIDRARFPRDKCCGDGLTTTALRTLEQLGLEPDCLPSWTPVADVWLRSPSGRTVHLPLPRHRGTYAAVVPRWELDAALVELARRAGAVVLDGHALRGAAAGSDGLALDVDGVGQVTARYAVGADGMWSPLRAALGVGRRGYRGEWHALRGYVAGVDARAAAGLWVWFDADLLPGYAWSFPLAGGRANVGFGVHRGVGLDGARVAALWRGLLERPHVRAVLGDPVVESPHRAWPIPAGVGRATLAAAGGRALFCGDAAAAADPLTGEGIGQALLTGQLAARAIVGAGPFAPERAERSYRLAVARELVADARMSGLLLGAVRHERGVRGAVRAAGASAWTRRQFARWLFEDYPRAYLATPPRWSEHSLTGPGAWSAPPTGARSAPPTGARSAPPTGARSAPPTGARSAGQVPDAQVSPLRNRGDTVGS